MSLIVWLSLLPICLLGAIGMVRGLNYGRLWHGHLVGPFDHVFRGQQGPLLYGLSFDPYSFQ